MTDGKAFPSRPNDLALAPFSWHHAVAMAFYSITHGMQALCPGL